MIQKKKKERKKEAQQQKGAFLPYYPYTQTSRRASMHNYPITTPKHVSHVFDPTRKSVTIHKRKQTN